MTLRPVHDGNLDSSPSAESEQKAGVMDGQVAIVTGGTGDIGRGVCRALTKAGATVVALDLDTSRAEGAARVLECDVTDPAACTAAVNQVVDEFGGVNTLVNLAQQFVVHTPLLEVTDDDMRVSFDSGPTATLRMMQLCYPHIKARGGGSIVNAASGGATLGMPGEGAYAAAKEAIRGHTKVAALEWGPDNIRVNAICPVATTIPDKFPEGVANSIPLRRVGDPETDIGSVIVFLAGPGAYITGRTLQIDGGAGSWR
jgi:NAD(P)-dependent dehydrogenase (short-subunit alcohol dehydrogenase family)